MVIILDFIKAVKYLRFDYMINEEYVILVILEYLLECI